jgi:hypothetical protein
MWYLVVLAAHTLHGPFSCWVVGKPEKAPGEGWDSRRAWKTIFTLVGNISTTGNLVSIISPGIIAQPRGTSTIKEVSISKPLEEILQFVF